MPPVSNVMPLPTRPSTGASERPAGSCEDDEARRLGCRRATPRSSPISSASISSRRAPAPRARCLRRRAARARRAHAGVSRFDGSLLRSRARLVHSARMRPRSIGRGGRCLVRGTQLGGEHPQVGDARRFVRAALVTAALLLRKDARLRPDPCSSRSCVREGCDGSPDARNSTTTRLTRRARAASTPVVATRRARSASNRARAGPRRRVQYAAPSSCARHRRQEQLVGLSRELVVRDGAPGLAAGGRVQARQRRRSHRLRMPGRPAGRLRLARAASRAWGADGSRDGPWSGDYRPSARLAASLNRIRMTTATLPRRTVRMTERMGRDMAGGIRGRRGGQHLAQRSGRWQGQERAERTEEGIALAESHATDRVLPARMVVSAELKGARTRPTTTTAPTSNGIGVTARSRSRTRTARRSRPARATSIDASARRTSSRSPASIA